MFMHIARVIQLLMLALACGGWRESALAADKARLAAQFQFDDWQREDGLPQNSVKAGLQSRSGYIWLGTYDGLARFDGVGFRVFDTRNTPELRSSRILELMETSDGNLWIGTDGGGLIRFKDGIFQHVPQLGFAQSSVSALCEGRDGAIWKGTVAGEVVRLKGANTTIYGTADGLNGFSIRALALDRGGRMWVSARGFLGYFLRGKLTRLPVPPAAVVVMGASRNGSVWVTINGELHRTEEEVTLEHFGSLPLSTEEMDVTSLYEDRKGDLWIGTHGGGLLRHRGGEIERFTTADGLSHNIVLCVFEDKEDNLWIGTHGGGLNRLKGRVFNVLDSKDGLSQEVVLSICQARDGDMWIGTDGGGLNRLRGGNLTTFSKEQGLREGSIWAVFEDQQTNLWAGSWGGGLYRRSGDQFAQVRRQRGLPGRFVRAIYEDRQARLWVGTYDAGVSCLEQGRFVNYSTRDGLSHNDVRAIHQDKAGNLWFGTGGGGLNRLAGGRLTALRKRDGLPNDFISTLHEDEDGALWIGTAAGLCRLKEGSFNAFTEGHGMPSSAITQVLEDGRGNFWIGSVKGILRVPRRDLEELVAGRRTSVLCVTYLKADGLGSSECNGGFQPAGWRAADGKLWFPTLRGVAIVDPNQLRVNKRPPQVAIEEVVANDIRTEVPDHRHERHQIELPVNAHGVEFRYTGLSFTAPRRVRFRYQLEGIDRDWVDARTRRSAYYGYLPPGEYRFQVVAANNDGIWNDVGSSIRLVIPSPYWQKWWFLSLCSAAVIVAIAAVARVFSLRKMQRRLAQVEHEGAIERERTRIARDMHDHIGASLTQIGLVCELARRDATAPDAVVSHAGKISETARDAVANLDEIVWAVNPKNDTLDKVASYLVHYAEEFFESSTVHCRFDVPAELPELALSAEVRHNLFLAFKEALTNVARHASASEVWVRLSLTGGLLTLTVQDNGCGFGGAGSVPAGNGMANMQSRLRELHGDCELISAPGQGSTLRFCVPLGR